MASLIKDKRFHEFVRLFNERSFFEAHEVLESLWRETPGRERFFYQGLIQIAAALVHLQRGNDAGCRALLLKAAGHLKESSEFSEGFPAEDLLRRVFESLEHGTTYPQIKH